MKFFYIVILFLTLIAGCQFQKPDYLNMISPTELQQVMKNQDIFLLDVHTPEQRHIKGTDLFIPYNAIDQHQDKLPQDKSTPIYLYCQGGPMGNSAAKKLHELGYQKLFNLTGGSEAWQKAGYEFD